MLDPDILINILKKYSHDIYTGVPCSYLKPLINKVIDRNDIQFNPGNNEGECIAIACGAYLAGKFPVVIFQNSGIGNALNPLSSLCNPFQIPLLLIVTWRFGPGIQDEPQHKLMGKITQKLLDQIEVRNDILPVEESTVEELLNDFELGMNKTKLPHALIVKKNTILPYDLQSHEDSIIREGKIGEYEWTKPIMSRIDAISSAVDIVNENTPIIATTGKTGRELFYHSDDARNMYIVGSMGCASSIGLGLALQVKKDIKVLVLDGDGAALMRLEAMVSIGNYRPPNLIHVILDNGVHDSTGGQRTLSSGVRFDKIAAACGYSTAIEVTEKITFEGALKNAFNNPGPHLIRVAIKPGSTTNLPRPSLKPHEVKERFMAHIRSISNNST